MKLHGQMKLALVVAAVFISGCATSTMDYTAPIPTTINNTKQVSQSFDVTWDKLVKQLSSDFFVINNIDKNSRLINLSFSSQKPSDFVDCGRTRRTFTNASGEQVFDYVTADSSAFPTTAKDGTAFRLKRTTYLDGRANIYVAPENGGTVVTVNAKYVVKLTVNFTTFDDRMGPTQTTTWDFSTKQGQTNTDVQCFATGSIERRILSMTGE